MNLKQLKIGDCCEVTSSKRIFYSEYVKSGVPFYRSKEIIQSFNGQSIDDPLYISKEKYTQILDRFGVPSAGDMLLTSVGTIGIPYIVKDTDYFYFKDGNLTWFRNFNSNLYSKYLYYWIQSPQGKGIINNSTIGSSQKALTISMLKEISLLLPSLTIQQRIVNILSAYDDLIENNQKQIKLLEEAVMRLYKEWFVNLRFPGYETVKIVDGVPEGWKRSTFKSLCELIKDSIKLGHINDDISYIGLEHIPRKSICLNKWGSSSDVNSDKYRYQKKDILFGKIRPYFHKVGFAINDGVCSTDAMVFRAKENYFGLLLTTAFSDEFVANSYATCREGAKMPRADWNEMGNYPVLIPHGKTLLVFNSITNDFFDLITNKHKQNHNLS
jgi:type I restriction enzyme S subunit